MKKTDFVALCRVYVSSRSRKKGRFRVCYHGYRKIISLFHVSRARQLYHSRFTNSIYFFYYGSQKINFTRNPLTAPLQTGNIFGGKVPCNRTEEVRQQPKERPEKITKLIPQLKNSVGYFPLFIETTLLKPETYHIP